jgi:hypothetical protein
MFYYVFNRLEIVSVSRRDMTATKPGMAEAEEAVADYHDELLEGMLDDRGELSKADALALLDIVNRVNAKRVAEQRPLVPLPPHITAQLSRLLKRPKGHQLDTRATKLAKEYVLHYARERKAYYHDVEGKPNEEAAELAAKEAEKKAIEEYGITDQAWTTIFRDMQSITGDDIEYR